MGVYFEKTLKVCLSLNQGRVLVIYVWVPIRGR